MAITEAVPEVTYDITTSSEGPFPVPFRFTANADLLVYLYEPDAAASDEDLLTLDAGYTVTGAGEEEGGELTLVDAAENKTLKIARSTAIERVTDFPSSGPFSIPGLNREFDRQIAIDQELRRDVDTVIADAAGIVDEVHDLLEAVAEIDAFDHIYETKAEATADIANIVDGEFVYVLVDESQNDARTIYQKQTGSLVLIRALPSIGEEDLVAVVETDFEVVPAFATMGDAVFAMNRNLCTYQRIGGWVHGHIDISFTLNAYTTAAGTFEIRGLPFASRDMGAGNGQGFSCSVSAITNVNYSTAQLEISALVANDDDIIWLLMSRDSDPGQLATVTNFPASDTYTMVLGFAYPIVT